MRERRLRRGVNMKGALKQKGVKQTCVKQGLYVFPDGTRLYNFVPKLTLHTFIACSILEAP